MKRTLIVLSSALYVCSAFAWNHTGHKVVAELMHFVDHGTYDLERLESERRAEARRCAQ